MDDSMEKAYPPGWFGDGWEYIFRVEQPVNMDVHMLKLLRWKGEGDELEQEYLSRDGWVSYSGFDMMRDLITMSGLRQRTEKEIKHHVIEAMVFAMGVEK